MELGQLSKRLSQYCWLVPDIKETFLNKCFFILMHVGGDICCMWAGVGKRRLSIFLNLEFQMTEQPDMYAGNWTQVLCANSPVPKTTDFECRQQSYMENTVIFLGFQSYRRTVSSYLQLFKHEVTFG